MDMGGLLVCYIRYPLVPHVRITNTCTYMYSHTWACYYVTPYMRKLPGYFAIPYDEEFSVGSLYKKSRNNMPIYGYMLPNLSPSPNLY